MALTSRSLFLYGFQITASNQFITFGTSVLEVGMNARTAVLALGFYSLSTLLSEVERALISADPTHIYTATADRTIMSGTQNRVTIATNFTYLSIYFSTGNPSNPASTLGFSGADLTGATSYTGTSTCGTAFSPNMEGYSFLPIQYMKKNFGVTSISASGLKESIVFSLQQFWQVQFKYIPESSATNDWEPLINWMVQQKELDFTPNITSPGVFYSGTLDDPGKGLELSLSEMLPNFPFQYQTPMMKFRLSPSST